jgi:hypothetical protein
MVMDDGNFLALAAVMITLLVISYLVGRSNRRK